MSFKVQERDVVRFFQRFNQGGFPHQRLGQAFLNHFDLRDKCHDNDSKVCLFNECSTGLAAKEIWENWVQSE